MAGPGKVHLRTWGCQMNVYDSERMAETLAAAGWATTAVAGEAALVVLNTCHIREKAAEKVYSEIGRLKPLKAANPRLRLAVAGCVAQAEGPEILARAGAVDLVVGPQAYHRLPGLAAAAADGARLVATEFPAGDKFDLLPARAPARRAPAAFLTVQEGCDRFCAFCVVPYTRGAEASRPAARVIAEARALALRGVREITLLGQNVNAYHGAGPDGAVWGLARLIGALAEIEGLARIRYMTSHPADMSDDLVALHGSEAKLMPFLHLPVQSGSDAVLKAMNRRHTAADYLRLIGRVRAARPDILISGDFIVGFPGETEADFRATLDLVAEVGYGQAYSFRYSPRPGTPAADRAEVDPLAADDRLARLQARIAGQQAAAQQAMVGREVTVLFEKPGREAGQMAGKSEHQMAVHVDDPGLVAGDLRRVRITRAHANSLAGSLV